MLEKMESSMLEKSTIFQPPRNTTMSGTSERSMSQILQINHVREDKDDVIRTLGQEMHMHQLCIQIHALQNPLPKGLSCRINWSSM